MRTGSADQRRSRKTKQTMFHNRPFTLALLLLGTAPLPLAAQQADTAARQGVQTAQTSPASSEPWSLARCLEYARANNLQVQSARITAEAGDIELEAAKAARYPTLSFNTGQNVSHQSAIKLINDYGEVVSDGSFSYGDDWSTGGEEESFCTVAINRRVKGSMSIDCLSLDDAHEYHEWSYTTARGETVSVYSGNHQFIVLYNGENAFISLVSQPGDSLGDDEIKAYVESVDLSALDKIGHINLPA